MASVAAVISSSTRSKLSVQRIHLPTVDSTNVFATSRVSTFDPAALTVVTADEQTAGRGRLGRQWASGAGLDVTATFAFRLPPGRTAMAYQLSPFLAVVLRRVLAAHGVAAHIKWPNDLLLGGRRKFAGILCELEASGGEFWAALGVGVNVNSVAEVLGASIVRAAWPLTTLRTETGRTWDVSRLTDDLVAGVHAALPAFLDRGFAPFQGEYEDASVLLGRTIRFREGDAGGPAVEGRVVALGTDGKLYLELPDGTSRGFLGGEVCGVEVAPGDVVAGHE